MFYDWLAGEVFLILPTRSGGIGGRVRAVRRRAGGGCGERGPDAGGRGPPTAQWGQPTAARTGRMLIPGGAVGQD